jgi:hypothetical protein
MSSRSFAEIDLCPDTSYEWVTLILTGYSSSRWRAGDAVEDCVVN